MELARLVIEALIFIFPAYCANAVPVISGGRFPLDLERRFCDGRRILGDNKTFRGFFSGLVAGTAVGLVESVLFNHPLALGLLLSIGALCGDLAGAFIKRRLGIHPGGSLPVVDQVSFITGGILFSLPVYSQILSLELVVIIFLVTPPIHLLTNFGAYKLGLKKSPW